MEEVNFRRFSTIAKSLGTIISISGAFIVTFYNGPAILNSPLSSVSFMKLQLPLPENWVLGGFLCACAALSVAAWCILQVRFQTKLLTKCYIRLRNCWWISSLYLLKILQADIMKMYPLEMIVCAFYCLFVTIQSSVVTLIAERDVTAWKFDTKIGLIAVFYLVSKWYAITISNLNHLWL